MAGQHADELPNQYDNLHVGIMLYDPETGDVVDANGHVESLVGYSTDELRELSIGEYSANTQAYAVDRMRHRLWEAARGSDQRFRWSVKRADGEIIWVKMHLSEYAVSGSTHVLAEVSDMTEQYITSRRLGLFSRLLRHNLRNEVNVISGRAEYIQRVSDTPRIQTDAAKIQEKSMDIGRLNDSAREIEQATTRTVADRSYENATAAVTDVVEQFRETHSAADISVQERCRMWIHVDDAFALALGHAIENAIVHNPDDEPEVKLTVGASPNTGRVEVRIVDTAPPIPDVEVSALKEFTDITSTSHGSGTGLFVMKWCLESLGGEVVFHRQLTGNVVSLYLPPKEPPDRVESNGRSSERIGS